MNDAHLDKDDAAQPTHPLEAAGDAFAETVEDLEDDVLILQARVRTLEQVVARLPGAQEIIAAVGDDEPMWVTHDADLAER